MGGERREKEGEGKGGEGREERDGRTNPKPAATGLRPSARLSVCHVVIILCLSVVDLYIDRLLSLHDRDIVLVS